MKANECMREALKTYEERGQQYGDSYIRHGDVMAALFPNGLVILNKEHWDRLGVLNMIISKLVRYTMNWQIPHVDSIHDMGVYCFIEEELARAHHEAKRIMQESTKEQLKEHEALNPQTKKINVNWNEPPKEEKSYHGLTPPKDKK